MSPQPSRGSFEVTAGPAAGEGRRKAHDLILYAPIPVVKPFEAALADRAPLPPKDFGVAVEAKAVGVGAEQNLA